MLAGAQAVIDRAGGVDFSTRINPTRDPLRALVQDAFIHADSDRVAELLKVVNSPIGARVDSADSEPLGLQKTLEARQALLAADTTAAILALEQGLRRSPWWVSAWAPLSDAAPQRWFLASAYAARGDRPRATRWLNSFAGGDVVGDLFYRPRADSLRLLLASDARQRTKAGNEIDAIRAGDIDLDKLTLPEGYSESVRPGLAALYANGIPQQSGVARYAAHSTSGITARHGPRLARCIRADLAAATSLASRALNGLHPAIRAWRRGS
jgi:hypothetical protein